jgi:hypothetical protein
MISISEALHTLNEEGADYSEVEAAEILKVLYKLAVSTQEQYRRKEHDQNSHHIHKGKHEGTGGEWIFSA